jgi:hypothetical protein
MLETVPVIRHEGCYLDFEVPDFVGHRSVTELELCEEVIDVMRAEQESIDAQWAAEQRPRVRFSDAEFSAEDALDAYLAACPDA